MTPFLIGVATVMTVVVATYWYYEADRDTITIRGQPYSVLNSTANKCDAARAFYHITQRVRKLIDHLSEKYTRYSCDDAERAQQLGISRQSLCDRIQVVRRLKERYRPESLRENHPHNPFTSDITATVNKGKNIYVCLRHKDNPSQVHSLNLVMYVMIHELAHVSAEIWGHPLRFWRINKFLLTEAVRAGVYDPVNYYKKPATYCGMDISENIYHANNVESI